MSKKIKKLWQSFYYAFSGIGYVVKSERNFRIHMVVACYILYFSQYFSLTKTELILLILMIALVFSAELINTAIEAMMNLQSPGYNGFVKIAKDCAAGAVLLFAIVSVMIGVILFWDMPVLIMIGRMLFFEWTNLLIFIVTLLLSFFFIFGFSEKEVHQKKETNQNIE